MHRHLLLFILAFPLAVCGQNNYSIDGQIGNLHAPAKVFLRFSKDTVNIEDSALLENGRFRFTGQVHHPTKATLLLRRASERRPAESFTFFIEPGNTKLTTDDSLVNAKASGNVNRDYMKLKEMLKDVEEKLMQVRMTTYGLSFEEYQADSIYLPYHRKLKQVDAEMKQVYKRFILMHPKSFVSLYTVKDYGGPYPDYGDVQPVFDGLSKELKNSALGIGYSKQLEQLKSISLGMPAKDFVQNNPEGQPVRLTSFRGNYVLLEFWASWCGPCRAEIPRMLRVMEKYKGKNFNVLAVSLDRPNDKQKWLKAISDDKVQNWTHVSDLNYFKNSVAVLYGVQAIPQNFLIDPNGVIIAKNLRAVDLEEKFAELFR